MNRNKVENKKNSDVFWIYILECENGNYYTGYTRDLAKRYQQHLNGTANSKYTRSFRPRRIVQCWQLFDTVGTALKIERFIKRKDKKTKELMIKHPDRLKEMVSKKMKINLELFHYDSSKMELIKFPTDKIFF